MRASATVTGEDPEPQPLDLDQDVNYDDWKAQEVEATSMIRLSFFPKVRHIIKGIRRPREMWNTHQMMLDTAGSYIGRQHILCQFQACWPKEDEPLKVNFTKLSNCRMQLDHTDDAITDWDFRMQIFTSLPSQYVMILIILKHRRLIHTPKEAMHDLLEEETTASLTKELEDASTGAALFSQCGGSVSRGWGWGHGRGGCGERSGRSWHGGSSGPGDSHASKCTYCKHWQPYYRCMEKAETRSGGRKQWWVH